MAPCSLWAIIQKPWDPELILKMCHLHPFNVKLFTVAAKLKALACIRLKWVHKLDHMSRV